jgi:homoserine O-acetyltransferase/serine/homoserine O-acetyltransferase
MHSFDPNSYLCLSRAIDLFDLGEGQDGDADAALAGLHLQKALVIGVTTDILFPIHQQAQIAAGLIAAGAEVRFVELDCIQGHDAFLIDHARFGPPVRQFLGELAASGASRRSLADLVAEEIAV